LLITRGFFEGGEEVLRPNEGNSLIKVFIRSKEEYTKDWGKKFSRPRDCMNGKLINFRFSKKEEEENRSREGISLKRRETHGQQLSLKQMKRRTSSGGGAPNSRSH